MFAFPRAIADCSRLTRAAREVLGLAALCSLASTSYALSAEDFDQAFELHRQALSTRDASQLQANQARWVSLSRAEPDDPVLRVHAGAATAMLAYTTIWPWEKSGHVRDGLVLLDQALAQLTPAHVHITVRGAPASLYTQFVAARTLMALPANFQRESQARELRCQVMASPSYSTTPVGFQQGVIGLGQGEQAAKDHPCPQAGS